MTDNVIENFVEKQLNYIDNELESEINEANQSNQSITQLQKRGVLLTNLRCSSMKSGLGGNTLLQLESQIGLNKLPFHKFKIGDILEIKQFKSAKSASKTTSSDDNEFKLLGTVTKLQDSLIVLSIKEELPNDLPSSFQLLKLANTVSYKRMKYALNDLQKIREEPPKLIRVLFNLDRPTVSKNNFSDTEFINQQLNDSQKDAVRFALNANELALIHGPPGTGKTQTCVEILQQLSKLGLRLLVCGPSNISVDNLVERLGKSKLDMLRIGHPARILESVLQHSLDVRLNSSDEGLIVNDVRNELNATFKEIEKTKRKSDRYKLYQEVKQLRKEVKTREKTVLKTLIKNAKIILTTLNGAATHLLKDEEFDVVLIDEASQALEAECWIPILKGKKLILAGDHKQLPPTIKSESIIAEALSVTLFDRLLGLHGAKIKKLLNVQYRMHSDIMNFSSENFYNGKLTCAAGVESRLLVDLPGVVESEETMIPLLFFDTNGQGFHELNDEETKYNDGEAATVVNYIKLLCDAGIEDSQIAVISPYDGQVRLLKKLLSDQYQNLELGTVDGFQGREKEIVILSLVRSNDKGEVGFLKEYRRLNVAITRPKRHLCVIGDSMTLNRDPFLKKMVDYFESVGEVRYP